MDGANDRNFDELLACFKQPDNPHPTNASAAQSTAPAIPFAPPAAVPAPVAGNDAQNFDELMSLFQPSAAQAAPAATPGLPGNPAPPQSGRPTSIPNATAVTQRAPPANRALQQEHRRRIMQQHQAVAAAAAANQAQQQRAAAISAPHVGAKQRVAQPRVPATSAALRQQRAPINHRAVQPTSVPQRMVRQQIPSSRSSQSSQPASITDELQAYLTTPTPAAQPHPQQRRNPVYQGNPTAAANGASATNRAAVATQRGGQRPVQGNGRQGGGRPPVTQEQVIVGHFCRHALACLTRLSAGLPNSLELQASLKHNIKRLWGEWVAENISKASLLESVARFVRQSCPAAANVNVITEFRAWYHHQLDTQRRAQRQGENPRAPTQREVAGRMPAGINNRAPNAGVTAPNPHAMPNSYQYQAARNAPPVTHPGMAMPPGHGVVNAGIVGRHPNSVQGRPGMPQTAKAPGRGRAPPKAAAQRNQASKTIPGKTIAAKTVPRSSGKLENQMMANPALAAMHGTSGLPMGARPKAPPPKPRGKITPQTKLKDEAALATMGNMGARPAAPPPKRPMEGPGNALMGSAQKKPRPVSKTKQSPNGKKPNGGVPIVPGKPRPPPPRGSSLKGGPPGLYMSAGPGAVQPKQGSAPGAVSVQGARPPAAPGQPGSAPTHRRKGFDDDLNFVTNIVDIDHEQNTLVGDSNEMSDVVGGDSSEYSSDMILVGGPLKAKIEAIMRRNGLQSAVSKDTMEMISLAARERLAFLLESVSEVARARVEADKPMWETKADGANMLAIMKAMREDEERTLLVQAQLRSSRYKKEVEEKAAKEAAEKGADEKSAKDAAAAAEQKRKAKAAAEKRRLADSSQRNALSGAISGIGKKRKRKKLGLAPFKGLSSASLKSLSNKTSATSGTSAGSLKAKGMTSAGSIGMGAGGEGTHGTVARRPPLTLRDCLAFMSGEPNMRQSTLVYKWHARLGAPRPGQGSVRSTRSKR